MRTVQPVGNPDNTCNQTDRPAILSGQPAVQLMPLPGGRTAMIPDGESRKNTFPRRKRQRPILCDERHPGLVMGNIRNTPANVMQKCGCGKQTPCLFAAAVHRGKIVIDRKGQTADLFGMTKIFGEEGCRLIYLLQILLFQITTRSFSSQ